VFATRIEVRGHPELNGPDAPYVSWDAVGPEFSRAMDVPIIRGRGISDQDREGAPLVAVITQDLATRYWPSEDPLGKQFRFAGVSGEDTTWRTVVGLIRPINYRTLRESTPTVLFSYRQEFQQGLFAVRSSRDLTAILPALRRAAQASDPDIVLWRAQTMDQILAGPLGRPRLETFLLAVFAGTALLLAAVGLYGVTAYLVRQQTRAIGVRIALGATTGHVLRLVFGGSLRIGLSGVVVGVTLSLFATRFVSAQLFEVSPGDPVALVGAAALLMLVIMVATYIPARRAARVDPVEALRAE
jgi:putative ABC transport system permease protein